MTLNQVSKWTSLTEEEFRCINIFQFKNDWSKCSENFKDVLPEVISSNLNESINTNQNNKIIFSIENNNNINANKKNLTKTKDLLKILKMVYSITVVNRVISLMTVKIEKMIKLIIKEEKLSNAEEIILKENIINVEIMQISWKKKGMIQAMQMLLPRITFLKIIWILI